MVKIIGICGGSCSGKTTLAGYIANKLGPHKCQLLRQDDYYFDIRALEFDGKLPNFDHPTTIDFKQLSQDLTALKAGNTIIAPQYDFTQHQRRAEGLNIEPRPFVILEGLLILNNEAVREKLDHGYFLDCSEDVRFARRQERDQVERKRDIEEINWQLKTHVGPCHDEFIQPSKIYADRIISQSEYVEDIEALSKTLIASWDASILG